MLITGTIILVPYLPATHLEIVHVPVLVGAVKTQCEPSQWRHNEHDGVSTHHHQKFSLNRLFRRKSKKHQSSASLAFVRGIDLWPVNSPQKGPATRNMFPFADVIMQNANMECVQSLTGCMFSVHNYFLFFVDSYYMGSMHSEKYKFIDLWWVYEWGECLAYIQPMHK